MTKDQNRARDGQVRQLKRLVLARGTFQTVLAACKYLIEHAGNLSSDVYLTMFDGMCVAYARPFADAEGVGQLNGKYKRFPADTEHAQTHNDLWAGRNSIVAHYSPKQAASLLHEDTQRTEQQKLRITIFPDGRVTFAPPAIVWLRGRLPAIVALCEFQIKRIDDETRSLLGTLGTGKRFPPGEYIIGETFP